MRAARAPRPAQLRLKVLEQRETVCCAAREADEDLSVKQLAHLNGVSLHDGGAERHLSVAAKGHPIAAPDGQDRRRVPVQGGPSPVPRGSTPLHFRAYRRPAPLAKRALAAPLVFVYATGLATRNDPS